MQSFLNSASQMKYCLAIIFASCLGKVAYFNVFPKFVLYKVPANVNMVLSAVMPEHSLFAHAI